MNHEHTGARGLPVILACVSILAVGAGLMFFLIATRQHPALADERERAIRVQTRTVQPESAPITIKGYGEVHAQDEVSLAVEVPGKVVEIHPKLEVGERVKQGELLFRIDPSDYQNNLDRARAAASQMENSVKALRQQSQLDADRAVALRRTRDLAKAQFERVKTLFEKEQVGTRAGVEQSEMSYNQASDAVTQIEQALAIYPTRIQEVESGLDATRAGLKVAESSLARTEVRAPFDGRLKMVRVEKDQYVAPGQPFIMLANDNLLKISVSVDSRDARRWLRFSGESATTDAAWFRGLESVSCRIIWPDDPEKHFWEGVLDRVEEFDPRSRTVTVAVNVTGQQALSRDTDQLPLVDGMYCQVEIPGKVLDNVYRLPRWAVTYQGTVYVSVDKRLQLRTVEVLRSDGDDTIVTGGLNPGDEVIITRLVDPLPNSLLEIRSDPALPTDAGTPAEGAA